MKTKIFIKAIVNTATNALSKDTSGIPELDGTGESTDSKNMPPFEFRVERQPSVSGSNPPYWIWKYFDHVENMEFVCVAVVALCGIRNVELEIAEDGFSLYINYVWPTAIFKPAELFMKAEDSKGRPLSMNHPKVHAFVANALDNGVNKFSNPKGQVLIELPQKVQRVPNTYRIEAMSVGDTNIILIELSAYHKAAVIEETNNAIVFK